MTNSAGIMATDLVIILRNHGLILICKYPSITIWPASVPVTVLLCPAAINAIANNIGARVEPTNGVNN